MATAYITEYAELGTDINSRAIQAGKEPALANQTVTYTTATASSAFSGKTRLIRVMVRANAFIQIGSDPTATAAKTPLTADVAEYFGVEPGHKISVYDGSS